MSDVVRMSDTKLTASQQGRVEKALMATWSDRTRASYASQWKSWLAWCRHRGACPLPADPESVAVFLAERAERVKMATVHLTRCAIAARHREMGMDDPARHDRVRQVLSGLARQYGTTQKQVAGLTAADLAAIKATALRPRISPTGRRESEAHARRRGLTDIALCSAMRDGLLRRSEAAGLTWGDIDRDVDGSGRLFVSRSKTDPTGNGCVLYLSVETMQCLDAIRPPDAAPEASAFRMTPTTVRRRIAAAARAAGLGEGYSGHSARIGMAQDLAAAGVELPALMSAGRWESPTMPARYVRNQEARRGAVARYYQMREEARPGATLKTLRRGR